MTELGFITRWGRPLPGRGDEALKVFNEAGAYYEKQKAAGRITYFERFFFQTGDVDENLGFTVVKGPMEGILAVLEDEERLTNWARVTEVVTHCRLDLLVVGQEIPKHIERMLSAERALLTTH